MLVIGSNEESYTLFWNTNPNNKTKKEGITSQIMRLWVDATTIEAFWRPREMKKVRAGPKAMPLGKSARKSTLRGISRGPWPSMDEEKG